jgi:hypothetical protein
MEKFNIWYMRPAFFMDGIMGYDWLDRKNMIPDPLMLNKTHIYLKQVEALSLERAYVMMQGPIWSPRGEARSLIQSRGLQHTSMSVGDVAISDQSGACWIVDIFGFKGIGITRRDPDLKLVS